MEDETVADYDVRSPASRTLLTVIGTMVAVAIVVGVVLGVSILKRNTKVATSVVDLGGSAQVVIDAGSADLRLVQGGQGVVKVSARITSGIRSTKFQIGRRGEEIKIVSGCQAWLSPGCGVRATLEVPKGLPVVIRTTSGDVEASSISDGVLTVTTLSGDVVGRLLRVDEFSANTSSGDVRASFATQPFAFKAATSSGDVTATIPAGRRTYAVTATSTSGDVSSSFDSDPDGEGFIRATSDSGDVSVRR